MAGTSLYKNKSSTYKQNLIDDLQKYGNLKLAIKNLEGKKKKKINLKPKKKKIQSQRQNQKRERKRTNHQIAKMKQMKNFPINDK